MGDFSNGNGLVRSSWRFAAFLDVYDGKKGRVEVTRDYFMLRSQRDGVRLRKKARCSFSARAENKYAEETDKFCHNCQTEWNYPEKVEYGEKFLVPFLEFISS